MTNMPFFSYRQLSVQSGTERSDARRGDLAGARVTALTVSTKHVSTARTIGDIFLSATFPDMDRERHVISELSLTADSSLTNRKTRDSFWPRTASHRHELSSLYSVESNMLTTLNKYSHTLTQPEATTSTNPTTCMH